MSSTDVAAAPRRNGLSSTAADGLVVGGATMAAVAVWAGWTQLLGVRLAADTGAEVREIGFAAVATTAAAVAVLGLLLCRVLVARGTRGLRWWTLLAAVVCAVSLLGTTGAVTALAGLGLTSLHLVVGAVVVLGARWARRAP